MNRDDERDLVIQALRGRLSRMSEASLRINESLDLDTVLQGVLDSARSLTGARYRAMTLLDDAAELPPDWGPGADASGSNLPLVAYFTSGLTEEQARRLRDMPERILLFDHLRRIPETLRIPDLASHTMSLDMADWSGAGYPMRMRKAMQSAPPFRHLGGCICQCRALAHMWCDVRGVSQRLGHQSRALRGRHLVRETTPPDGVSPP